MLKYDIDDVREGLRPWFDYMNFELQSNYYKAVSAARSQYEDFVIPFVDDLTYRQEILFQIEEKYNFGLTFTKEEILQNRLIGGLNDNMKLTKFLSKKIREKEQESEDYTDKRIDFFNSTYSGEIYLTLNPMLMCELYYDIQTCHSPEGSQAHNFLKMLLSKYIYIAFDKSRKFRMIVFIDHENKRFYMSPLYGQFNIAVPISIAKYFTDLGYKHIANPYKYFDTTFFDYDGDMNAYAYNHISFIQKNDNQSGENRESENYSFCPIPQVEDFRTSHDVINGYYGVDKSYSITSLYCNDEMISLEDGIYCECCGRSVDTCDYNYDVDMCYDCYSEDHFYCYKCDEWYPKSDYVQETDSCVYCANRKGYQACVYCDTFYKKENLDEFGYCPDCRCDENEEDEESELD